MPESLLDAAIGDAMAEFEGAGADPEPTAEPATGDVDEPEAPAAEPDDTADVDADETDPDEGDDPAGSPPDEPEADQDGDGKADEDSPESDDDEAGEDERYTVKVDGEEFAVTLDELRNGYQRQSDYTRKSQALADERRQLETVAERMREWYETRAADPAGWALEIATQTDNPGRTLADAIGRTDDPTGILAWTIRSLAEGGKLSDRFVEAFGLEEVNGVAAEAEKEDRVSRLEREVREEREQRAAEERRQQILAEYERQWETVKDREGLTFDSPKGELDARIRLMQFAREQEIGNLETAYAAMAYRGEAPKPAEQPSSNGGQPADEEAKAALERKRKTRAMQRKPVGGRGAKPRKPGDLDAAIREAAAEAGFNLG